MQNVRTLSTVNFISDLLNGQEEDKNRLGSQRRLRQSFFRPCSITVLLEVISNNCTRPTLAVCLLQNSFKSPSTQLTLS